MLPFAQSLGGQFVYDDHALIEQREAVHSLSRLPELWQSEFWQGITAIHFRFLRPLVSTSYALDWALYGGRPAGFHATNLLLHATVALLLYATLRRWSTAPIGALVTTLAWAWHPSKVEAVSFVSGRTDLICALGILVTCAGVRRRLSGSVAGGALEALGLVVAFASKESAVVVPAFVFVEAWAFLGRPRLDRAEITRATRVALPHVGVALLYVAARTVFLPIVPERAWAIPFADARLYTLETLGEFARIVLFPIPLSVQRAPIRLDAAHGLVHDPWRLALGAAAIAVIVLAIAALRRGLGAAHKSVGCLLAAAALVPVSNLVSARAVFLFAERFAYVPLMGLALSVIPTTRPRALGLAAWTLVLGASFFCSAGHTRDFLDDRSLWKHELAVNPRDPLGLRFACEDAMRRHDERAALGFALRGYEASSGWPVPRPDRVDFAARAARSLELVTLDADTGSLQEIVGFYRTLLVGRGTARLQRISIAIEADGAEAKNFRQSDPSRVASLKLWAAVAASRLADCDFALPLARESLPGIEEINRRVSAALVLARCSAWEDALLVARGLETQDASLAELRRNLEWARSVAGEDYASLAGALRWSRAQTLLLNRGPAYVALVPWQADILLDPDATVFFARTAWAAGEDAAARQALGARMSEADAELLLASWSKDLGRN